MFLWQGAQRQFDHLMGTNVSMSSVEAFAANLRARSSACMARNVRFLHVVFPSKPVVMTEKLPEGMRTQIRSLFERQYSIALDAVDHKFCLYPRMLLRDHKNDQTFRQIDTHMTATGNALVTREILRRLGYAHDPLDHMEAFTQLRHGDLSHMAGMDQKLPELFLETRKRTAQIWDNRLSLPSNTDNIVICHNPHATTKKRLLALGDSFLRDCLLPLSTYFRDILYVRSAQFQPELLNAFAPDCVITANAERYLSKVEPDTSAESVLMRGYGRKDYEPAQSFVEALRAQLAWKHYPARYEAWFRGVNALTFEGLGVGQINSEICQIPNEPGWMESIGNDPQIVFHNTTMIDGSKYELEIEMMCNVSCCAQLFLANSAGKVSFSEQYSHRINIIPGRNIIRFNINSEFSGNKIRFDPMNIQGKFLIESMKISKA